VSTVVLDKTVVGLTAYVRRSLGEGVVALELSADQVTDAIQAAVLWFMAYQGQIKYGQLDLTAATEYDVEDDVDQVMELILPDGANPLDTSSWADVPWELPNVQGSLRYSYGMTDIVLSYQYLEQFRRVVGSDTDWEYDPITRKLTIAPSPGSGKALYAYSSKEVDLAKLRNTDFMLVRERALAEAQYRLGMIRTKYSEVPSADGSFTMNGDTLISEAQGKFQALDEQIKNLVQHLPFIMG